MINRQYLVTRLQQLRQSPDVWHGVVMTGSMLVAGVLDYLFSLLSGRWLAPAEYGILIAVQAILQILLHATNVIRNVVAYYVAEIWAETATPSAVAPFLRRRYRWAWQYGLLATLLMALISPLLARWLQFPTSAPLWAASLALVMLFVRPVTDGTLQGLQQFPQLSAVQVLQASLRLGFAIVLIRIGWGAFGAVVALPLATTTAFFLAYYFLRPYWVLPTKAVRIPAISRRYSTHTLVGLLTFALMVNLDAIAVKRLFDPAVAGNYGPIVTLGKINLFVPLAIAMVLFPKAVERHTKGEDARPILLASLAAAIVPGLGLSFLFFLFPDWITLTLFGDEYTSLGVVMPLVGLATTFFAGINVWLNYALSTARPAYVYCLAALLGGQVVALWWWHGTLEQVGLILMVVALAGNVVAAGMLLRR
ncbi:MAG TPA: hypothetical protein VLL52_01280 [Anaerolineae bacterium]|nr:hypothetical protein [Anaerolineae bacterium]